MKVALGHRIHQGPWGGGNRFVSALADALKTRGDSVVFSLADPDIDLILIVDPRARNPGVAFTPGQILRYLIAHPRTLVVHRINECDERKGTRTMNFRLRLANYLADHTVFIGSWLADLEVWLGKSAHSVILNGADKNIFNDAGYVPWLKGQPLRLVTHHWGAHAFKGFDVYNLLDDLLDDEEWRRRFEMTYIGNLPQGCRFRNIRHLKPLNGPDLAQELCRHHAYITASTNEPAGMHHIEGALCGLPLLFRDSGALPEYCHGFGEMFEGPQDVALALMRMIANYADHRLALKAYVQTSERMCDEYLSLFDNVLDQRDARRNARRLWRNPFMALLTQLPL